MCYVRRVAEATDCATCRGHAESVDRASGREVAPRPRELTFPNSGRRYLSSASPTRTCSYRHETFGSCGQAFGPVYLHMFDAPTIKRIDISRALPRSSAGHQAVGPRDAGQKRVASNNNWDLLSHAPGASASHARSTCAALLQIVKRTHLSSAGGVA